MPLGPAPIRQTLSLFKAILGLRSKELIEKQKRLQHRRNHIYYDKYHATGVFQLCLFNLLPVVIVPC